MKKTERIDYGSSYAKVREYVDEAHQKFGYTIQGAFGRLLIEAVKHDALDLRGSRK